MSDTNTDIIKESLGKNPWYTSVKKTLGVIGFILYWAVQVPAIIKDPTVIISLAPVNMGLVLGLLGIKSITGAVVNGQNKKAPE